MQDPSAAVKAASISIAPEVKSALDSLLEISTQLGEWVARVDDAQLRHAYASLLARLNHLRYGGGHE